VDDETHTSLNCDIHPTGCWYDGIKKEREINLSLI
jgi:hypothetical protein